MDCETIEERRLWIGNLDTRLSDGPQVGQSRGYAFVTYKTSKESLKALEKLHGTLVGSKHVAVRLAKNINYDELEKPKPKIEIPCLAAGSSKDKKVSKEVTIKAIEAKLKLLENRKDDFEVNRTATNEMSLLQKYQFNMNGESSQTNSNLRQKFVKHKHHPKPYSKNTRSHRR